MDKVRELIIKYARKLGMTDFAIDVAVSDNKHGLYKDGKYTTVNKNNDEYAEVTEANYGMRRFTMMINRWALTKELKDTIVHELIHIMLWGFTDLVDTVINLTDLTPKEQDKLREKLAEREHEVVERIIRLVK